MIISLKQMRKIYLMIFVMLLLGIVPVVAEDIYKLNEDLKIQVPCVIGGSPCSASSTCNITTIHPNDTVLVYNLEMTNQVSFHNFTVNGLLIDAAGGYKNIMNCKDGIYNGTDTFILPVTSSGTAEPDGKGTIIAAIFIVIFGIACLFLFFSDRMTEVGPKIFFLLGAFVFLLGSVGIMGVVAYETNLTMGVSNTIGYILFALGMVFYILFGYIMIRETVAALDLFRNKKYFGDEAY